jgi:PhoPQ-activated pathogenicity-related protein
MKVMNTTWRGWLTVVLAWGLGLIPGWSQEAARPAGETALDRYVQAPDPSYAWKVLTESRTEGATQFVVDLTSQTWRNGKEVSNPVWKHWLTVIRPEKTTSATAILVISGGANIGEPPKSADPRLVQTAVETSSVVAEIRMVPNQPLVFNGDGKNRREDDLIAYTWVEFLKTGDESWPARLPMVKSVVRAMDCVQELLASERGGKHNVETFVLAGASKRGWTTWCAGAVDKRVVGVVPMVIDVLNVQASMRHHVAAYGFYSLAVGDYFRQGIMQRESDPALKRLYEIEDPYSYRDRLTMPKYIVNAAGDQFFLPDSSQFYFDDLKGEKHLRYIPNTDHSLRGSDAWENILAFCQLVLAGKPRPKYSWSFEKDGSIRVACDTSPKEVVLWSASNPKSRDFRLSVIGKAYASRPLTAGEGGMYVARVDPPKEGWTAFFVELTFDIGGSVPFKATSGVRVVPETLPHSGVDPSKAPLETVPAGK